MRLHRARTSAILSLFAVPTLLACAGEPEETADVTGPAATASGSEVTPSEPDGEPRGEVLFEAREGWIEEQPSSSMRVTQFRLPHAAGDAEIGVFKFPGGGSVEANFQRWAGQFAQPDGSDSMEAATFSEQVVGGMPVHLIDVSGTYTPAMFGGPGDATPQAGWRLLGAVIESPYGMYFVKATGPGETLAHWESSYNEFIGGLRP